MYFSIQRAFTKYLVTTRFSTVSSPRPPRVWWARPYVRSDWTTSITHSQAVLKNKPAPLRPGFRFCLPRYRNPDPDNASMIQKLYRVTNIVLSIILDIFLKPLNVNCISTCLLTIKYYKLYQNEKSRNKNKYFVKIFQRKWSISINIIFK